MNKKEKNDFVGGDIVEAYHISSDKKRPFMILGSVFIGTKKKYNAVPMSRTNFLLWTSYQLDTGSFAHCNRIIELDENQIFHKMDSVSEEKYDEVKARAIGNLSTMKYGK